MPSSESRCRSSVTLKVWLPDDDRLDGLVMSVDVQSVHFDLFLRWNEALALAGRLAELSIQEVEHVD